MLCCLCWTRVCEVCEKMSFISFREAFAWVGASSPCTHPITPRVPHRHPCPAGMPSVLMVRRCLPYSPKCAQSMSVGLSLCLVGCSGACCGLRRRVGRDGGAGNVGRALAGGRGLLRAAACRALRASMTDERLPACRSTERACAWYVETSGRGSGAGIARESLRVRSARERVLKVRTRTSASHGRGERRERLS